MEHRDDQERPLVRRVNDQKLSHEKNTERSRREIGADMTQVGEFN
jgi:hypothetical protein